MTDVFKGEHARVDKVGGRSVFSTNDNGPFMSNVSPAGVPVRRQLKHAADKMTVERIGNKLYIELSMSRNYEKSHDHIMGRLILDADQIELLKRILNGEAR